MNQEDKNIMNSYKQKMVQKPWGYEYLVYENDKVGLWLLHIVKDQQTSMHCHPNKTTGLMVLDGDVEVSFIGNTIPMKPVSKTMIRKGLFHSTKAVSEGGAFVFEIETPVDKHDLVRLEDKYGRQGKPYENSAFEIPKQDNCLWFDNLEFKNKVYKFANCNLNLVRVTDTSFFRDVDDDRNIMFLSGGILTDYNINVAGAGDIVKSDALKELIRVFEKVDPNTIVVVVEKSNE